VCFEPPFIPHSRLIECSGGGRSSSHVAATIGAAVGGIVVGLIVGAAGIFAFFRRYRSKQRPSHRGDLIRDSHHSISPPHSRQVTSSGGTTNIAGGAGLEYIVEPFAMPSPGASDPSVPLLPDGSPPVSPPDATSASGSDPADQSSNGRRTNVYVVHHDAGRAPVTVYAEAGAEVVELPPRYADSGSTEGSGQSRRERKGRGPRPI
jgi:hypothetical protein